MKALYVKSRTRRVIARGSLFVAQEQVSRPDGVDTRREHGWRDTHRPTDKETAIGQVVRPRDGLT